MPRIEEYENEEVSKIHLSGPINKKNSERETLMLDHQGQISITIIWPSDQYIF